MATKEKEFKTAITDLLKNCTDVLLNDSISEELITDKMLADVRDWSSSLGIINSMITEEVPF